MHFFEENVAALYGVQAAVLFQNIYYWCQKNKANGRHLHRGYYWTFNSEKAFVELFPYMTKWQIRNALKKLIDDGVVITDNFNQSAYDRTLWYAVTEKGENLIKSNNGNSNGAISKLEKCNLDVDENQFGNNKKSTPIPYIKPDINETDIKTDIYTTSTLPAKKQKEQKSHYGEYENVLLTETEYNRLVDDYGEPLTHDAIKFLDEYIEEKGYKAKSHNLTMRRWVFDAVREKKSKPAAKKKSGDYDWTAVLDGLSDDQ